MLPCHCELKAWQSPGIPRDCFGRLGDLAMTKGGVIASRRRGNLSQLFIQIPPFLVHLVNQINFLLPRSRLEMLLSHNCILWILKDFVIYELGDVVFSGKPIDNFFRMLVDPSPQVISNTSVKNRVPYYWSQYKHSIARSLYIIIVEIASVA